MKKIRLGKSAHVLVWVICFNIVLLYFTANLGLTAFANRPLRDPIIESFFSFIKNSASYANAPSDRQRVVIVGPSYAADFGNLSGSFNLGVYGACDSEIINHVVRRYCEKNDKVIYFINLYEFQGRSAFNPRLLNNLYYLKMYTFRILVREAMGLEKRCNADEKTLDRVLPRVTDTELASFQTILRKPRMDDITARMAKAMLVALNNCPAPNTRRHKDLAAQYPDLVYVILPVAPSHEKAVNRDIDMALHNIKSLERILLENLQDSHVKLVNLASVLGVDDYSDFIHLNARGKAKAAAFLEQQGVLGVQEPRTVRMNSSTDHPAS